MEHCGCLHFGLVLQQCMEAKAGSQLSGFDSAYIDMAQHSSKARKKGS